MQPEHAEPLLRAASISRDTYSFTGVPADLDAARRYIDTALADRERGLAVPFVQIARATGEVVGSTRFGDIEYWSWPAGHPLQRPAGIPSAVESGWTWLAATYQRTGINTEAKLLLLTHAFETWKVHRVTFRTDARNERSRRNIERVGARLDGILRANMPGYDGTVRDSAFYSMLDSEWPAAKAALTARLR